MSFGNYSSQAPKVGKTSPCVLRGLRNPDGSHPIVHVEYLGEENTPFHLEMLANAQSRNRTSIAATTPTEIDRQLKENRADNREIIIRHSARRIENVVHADGTPATDKETAAFIRSIPDCDFEILVAHAQDLDNYRDTPVTGEPQVVAEK